MNMCVYDSFFSFLRAEVIFPDKKKHEYMQIETKLKMYRI